MKSKMRILTAIKIWVVIYPSITLFLFLFGEQMTVVPLYIRTLILTLILVPWMMFVGVPFIDWILRAFSTAEKQDQVK